MRTTLTSGSWVEAAATLAAAVLMTVAGFAALQDGPAASNAVVAPVRVLNVVGATEVANKVAMPHVDVSRG
jgi:hypothetical protein